jgi:hypothetical protein
MDSLVESAQVALVSELRRRNLDDQSVLISVSPSAAQVESKSDQAGSGIQSRVLWFGLFFLNTFLVYVCALQLAMVLVGRWFAWVVPLFAIRSQVTSADWYLRHLELVTIIPALAAGYIDLGRFLPAIVGKQIAERRSSSAGSWTWTIPTGILLFRMLRYHSPSSVLLGSSMSVFKYFFDIQRFMPTFSNPLASDPIRVWAQMSVTAPFYAGLAYSLGALAWKRSFFTVHFNRERHATPTIPQQL